MKLNGDHCQCAACNEYFNSTKAFDKHRTGEWGKRLCRTVEAMEAIGMARNSRGFWITEKRVEFSAAQHGSSGDRPSPT